MNEGTLSFLTAEDVSQKKSDIEHLTSLVETRLKNPKWSDYELARFRSQIARWYLTILQRMIIAEKLPKMYRDQIDIFVTEDGAWNDDKFFDNKFKAFIQVLNAQESGWEFSRIPIELNFRTHVRIIKK